jgi:hypothetical protein
MRALTLHEKITFKGLLSFKGVDVPKLDMKQLLHYWHMTHGIAINRFPLCRRQGRARDRVAPITTWETIWWGARYASVLK